LAFLPVFGWRADTESESRKGDEKQTMQPTGNDTTVIYNSNYHLEMKN